MMENFTVTRLINILHRNSQIYVSRQLRQFDIGFGQHSFLLIIHNNPGITQDLLSKKMLADKGTTAKAVKHLEEMFLLTREVDMGDKRVNHLYLTDEGTALVEHIHEVSMSWRNCLFDGFTPEQEEESRALLVRMAENAVKFCKACKNE